MAQAVACTACVRQLNRKQAVPVALQRFQRIFTDACRDGTASLPGIVHPLSSKNRQSE